MTITGAKDAGALEKADLAKSAELYLTRTVGLTQPQVQALKAALTK